MLIKTPIPISCPSPQQKLTYVVRYPLSAMGHTSVAYVMVRVWKMPQGTPQRISAASRVWTFWAVKKIEVKAATRTRQVRTV